MHRPDRSGSGQCQRAQAAPFAAALRMSGPMTARHARRESYLVSSPGIPSHALFDSKGHQRQGGTVVVAAGLGRPTTAGFVGWRRDASPQRRRRGGPALTRYNALTRRHLGATGPGPDPDRTRRSDIAVVGLTVPV